MRHWAGADLATLRRLRERFLAASADGTDYWECDADLALYDATFAERIGWKWDAVLRELTARGWSPQSTHALDWGCGAGVASRRVLARWPQFESLTLHDRSPRAVSFATERARAEHPQIEMRSGAVIEPDALLIISHVLNELSAPALAELLALARQAREILWVEAGTHADSRRLIAEVREPLLRDGFAAVAPCTHQRACGLLAPENARHWCHHFAAPPSRVFQDARWHELSRELGIDLRALPYSFIVLERPRAAEPTPSGFSRIIGEPRAFKGYDKVLSCQAEGVAEFMLQKRDAPALLRELHQLPAAPVYRWTLSGGKIAAGERLLVSPEAVASFD